MTNRYLNPSALTNGTGTEVNPWNTAIGLPPLDKGDNLLFKCGTVFREGLPASLFVNGRIKVGYYGTGPKPIFDGSIDVPASSWTYDAPNNVWSLQLAAATGGHVTEGTRILRFVEWRTDVATTAAAMYPGTACWNYHTNVIYVRPPNNEMTGKVLRVSNIRTGVFFDAGADQCEIDGLVFLDYSKESQIAQNCHGVLVSNCNSYRSGGWRDSGAGAFIGGAFGAGTSTRDFTVYKCIAEDVFDSPFSSQLYALQPHAQTLINHVYEECTGRRFGYAGFEWTALSPKQRVLGIYMLNSLIEDGANESCWHSYARDHVIEPGKAADTEKGSGIAMIGGHKGSGALDQVYAKGVVMRRVTRGGRNSFSTGALNLYNCVIEDATMADLWVNQLSLPGYPRTTINHWGLERINSPGPDFIAPGEYPEAIRESIAATWAWND